LGSFHSGYIAVASGSLSGLSIEVLRIPSGGDVSLKLLINLALPPHKPVAVGEVGLVGISASRVGLGVTRVTEA
jgi:hypothetical protein